MIMGIKKSNDYLFEYSVYHKIGQYIYTIF